MDVIRDFNELISYLRQRADRKRVAVVWPYDKVTQEAVSRAIEAGFAEAILVGCRAEAEKNPEILRNMQHITFVDAVDCDDAARKAVAIIRDGQADILMKGKLNTDNFLHPVLNKESGILRKGSVLTHITATKIPTYDKLLFFTDAAVIPYPTQAQRMAQIKYIAYVGRAFGIERPRIALIHCSEKIDERHFPFTGGFAEIKECASAGEFGPCILDGPMDVKTACSLKAMKKKDIESPIMGQADALVFPDIEAANMFYKTLSLFCHAVTAAVLQGAMCPVVLPSRGDDATSKFNSLALAAL